MEHSYTFGQEQRRQSETRTAPVIVLTVASMVVEIGEGVVLGPMTLPADGLHMGAYAVTYGIICFAFGCA